ncbi:hypothetical protein V2I29_05090 [Campylobacter sp. CX2-8023-23]|uniref:hypothetical protein n=1 Tax=Campylobacter porcelli TaxID=1660073 RepID=UPI002EBBE9F3|nr:hypothetical protein [Campylobacter sp. CX2-8023-23]
MDFLDSLKEIKGKMVKEQKATPKQSNPNKDEIKDIFDEAHKEARLRDEFMEFIKYSDIKKLD